MFSLSSMLSSKGPDVGPGATAPDKRDEKKDLKSTPVPVATLSQQVKTERIRLATLRNRSSGKGLEGEAFRLPVFYSGTTTAATTYTTVISLTPSDSTEYSAIAALFDEIIVDSYHIQWVLGPEISYTTFIPALWGIAFDPISSAAMSSTAGIVQHSHHFLWGMGVNAGVNTPEATTRRGMFSWDVKVPPGSVRTQAGVAWFGHDWSSTSDTGNFYGFLKPYWKSLGATGTHGFEMIVTYNVRVRSRT